MYCLVEVGYNWVQVGADIVGEASSDRSGRSVSMSADGSRVAIGAPGNNGVNGENSGHVRVYELQSGSWVQMVCRNLGHSLAKFSFHFREQILMEKKIQNTQASNYQ